MQHGNSLPIEEFLEAVTAQLDKTQDALRMKAVNRPLTFALKDFAIDLQVFIEMNADGDILFRPSGPNETGASTVNVAFTTITRPMIEENTVSMEMSQSPSLEEVGLAPAERVRLERLGVRNAAQLRRLEESAGDSTMSRLSGVNVSRLRDAINLSKPQLEQVVPDSAADQLPNKSSPQQPGREGLPINPVIEGIAVNPGTGNSSPLKPDKPHRLTIKPGDSEVKLRGSNLLDGGRLPKARLDRRPLKIRNATENEITLTLPTDVGEGHLEIELQDGQVKAFTLTREIATQSELQRTEDITVESGDPWLPDGATT